MTLIDGKRGQGRVLSHLMEGIDIAMDVNGLIASFAQDDSDARLIVGMPRRIIHRRQIEIHLPGAR